MPDEQKSLMPEPGYIGYKVTSLLKNYLTGLQEQSQQSDVEAIIKLVEAYTDQFKKLCGTNPASGWQAVIKAADDVISATPEATKNQFQCKPGCTHCCYIDLDISQNEAAAIINYCLTNDIDIDREHLMNQVEIGRNIFSKYSRCVFLKETICSIYPVRPMNCRKHYVYTDPSLCDNSTNTINQIGTFFDLHTEIYASAMLNISETGPIEKMLIKELNTPQSG